MIHNATYYISLTTTIYRPLHNILAADSRIWIISATHSVVQCNNEEKYIRFVLFHPCFSGGESFFSHVFVKREREMHASFFIFFCGLIVKKGEGWKGPIINNYFV